VQDANGHEDFPIQNLPFGIFRPPNAEAQAGIAIGDHILALRDLAESGLLDKHAEAACKTAREQTLNQFFGLGAFYRTALRKAASALLAQGATERPELLHKAADCELLLPARIGDYTDFYAGIVHAENVGKLFRPETPLLPNYKWVPIGYHGRASSVRVSGQPVRRPYGQHKMPNEENPTFGPVENLDFELELGIWISSGNTLGETICIEDADSHIGGYCLLNDWSARDIQSWEYQPLGPFLSKSFHTTISGWVITPEALAPFRQPQSKRGSTDPRSLPYLSSAEDQAAGALNVSLEVFLNTVAMTNRGLAPFRLTKANVNSLYWTPAQLVTHHASNGCNLMSGDLLGTGTISSPTPGGAGSLLEITEGGKEPIRLPSGETRLFLCDGDEVTFRARACREGYVSIGFGECRGVIFPAKACPER
jgi:fumarylacetoacetase